MTTWSHSQFVEQVKSGQIESVIMSNDGLEAVATKRDGQQVTVNLSSTDLELIPVLQQNGVDVSMVPQQYEDSFPENNSLLVLPIFPLLISAAIALGGFLFWLWMLIDCAMKETDEGNSKLVWVLIILFVNFLGALAYFFIRRPQRLRDLGQ
nr:PLD nuclease N-terminal domain-containing protein [Pseudanabaena sp. FACHB-2040]